MRRIAAVFTLLIPALFGQVSWDSTGNNLLRGTYNFRQLHLETGDEAGNYSRQIAVWGQIQLDGNGNYTLANAKVLDSNVGTAQTLALTGTYSISSSGYGFLDSPAFKGELTFGLVSQGIFIGSSTEADVNDLFIAAPTSTQTDASFTGQYWIAEMAFPARSPARTRDAFFQINPNGSGGLGNISVTGYTGGSGNVVRQTIGNARYSFSTATAGAGTIAYGNLSTLVPGTRLLYVSPDRNFVFGGSEDTWDMFVGVRALAGRGTQESMSGLFYFAGMDQDNSALTSGGAAFADSYYGSFLARSGGILGHQRLLFGFDPDGAFDYSYSDTYSIGADGSHDDFFGAFNIIGAGGNIRIGYGTETYLGISVAVKAPDLTGPGVFVNPHGVINAASYAPFTSGISNGELIRIFGTNLAAAAQTSSSFPTTLGGVRVTINNRAAPLYLVSPGEIVAQVPWGITGAVAAIQVTNGNTASNVVTTFRAPSTPGVFSLTQNGSGSAAALHADFSLVDANNPARIGETIQVYLTGLGAVTPTVADGAPGSSAEPLSRAQATALVDGLRATVAYAGLAPGLVGLYQMNITIPNGVTGNRVFLDISGVGATTSQVTIPMRAANASSAEPEVAPVVGRARTSRPPGGERRNVLPTNEDSRISPQRRQSQ